MIRIVRVRRNRKSLSNALDFTDDLHNLMRLFQFLLKITLFRQDSFCFNKVWGGEGWLGTWLNDKRLQKRAHINHNFSSYTSFVSKNLESTLANSKVLDELLDPQVVQWFSNLEFSTLSRWLDKIEYSQFDGYTHLCCAIYTFNSDSKYLFPLRVFSHVFCY